MAKYQSLRDIDEVSALESNIYNIALIPEKADGPIFISKTEDAEGAKHELEILIFERDFGTPSSQKFYETQIFSKLLSYFTLILAGYMPVIAITLVIAFGRTAPWLPFIVAPLGISVSLWAAITATFTLNFNDVTQINSKNAFKKSQVFNKISMLLPDDKLMSWEDQAKAAQLIDDEALQNLLPLLPTTFNTESGIAFILNMLLTEQIEDSDEKAITLANLAEEYADVITIYSSKFSTRFIPEMIYDLT